MSVINGYIENLKNLTDTFPDKVMMIDHDGQRYITYSLFWEQVQKIASAIQLQLSSNTSSEFIPIVLPDDMEYIAATVAVWCTGHANVYLGSSFPQDRIDYVIRETKASLVINEDFIQCATQIRPFQITTRSDTDSCALFYTSGSTGKYKGILHSDKGFMEGIERNLHCCRFSEFSSFFPSSPCYFIAIVFSYSAIYNGNILHLLSAGTRKDILKIESYCADHYIEGAFFPASTLNAFQNHCKALKIVITGSERFVGNCNNDYTIINTYGQTETCVTVIGKEIDQDYENIPIGLPVDPIRVSLFDENCNPIPDGEDGELVITSGLTPPVYFKDSEKTQALMRGGVFHTGDIMRRLPNGDYLFVQRKDWMVKINGQRVEPGEIESAMRDMPSIKDAIVKGFTTPDQSRQYLVAYFIPLDEQTTAESIKRHLSKSLPSYMVPLYYVKMEAFPRNANGKTDRRSLPAPDEAFLHNTYTAPRTALEERLCDAFARVLGVTQVGIDDDFFQLGGDSIRTMQLQHACSDLSLGAVTIYQHRTPRLLAEVAENQIKEKRGSVSRGASGANKNSHHENKHVALSPTQLSLWMDCIKSKDLSRQYNVPLLMRITKDSFTPGVEMRDVVENLKKVIQLHIQHNDAFRSSFPLDDTGQPFLQVAPYSEDETILTVESIPEQELEKRILAETQINFDLVEGPLHAPHIYCLEETQDVVLLWVIHHLTTDGWSCEMIEDNIYQHLWHGKEPEWSDWSYLDYTVEENKLRKSEVFKKRTAFWHEHLKGCSNVTLPAAGQDSRKGKRLFYPLPADTEERLQRFSKLYNVGSFSTVYAVFQSLIHRYSAETDFITIFPTANRSKMEYANMCGYCVHPLPMKFEGAWRELSWGELAQKVSEEVLRLMSNILAMHEIIQAVEGMSRPNICFVWESRWASFEVQQEDMICEFDLTFHVQYDEKQKWNLMIEYNSERFDAAFIRSFADAYVTLLLSLESTQPVSSIPLCSPQQIGRLIQEQSLSAQQLPEAPYWLDVFAKVVQEHPDKTAVIEGGQKVTFAELDRLSSAFALQLQSEGVETGSRVILEREGGIEFVSQAIGTWKHGCSYVPVDPQLPQERKDFILRDAQSGKMGSPSDPEAYVIYTSGSTGRPKGISISQSAVARMIIGDADTYGYKPDSICMQFFSVSFDPSVTEIFTTLSCGLTLVIIDRETRHDPYRITQLINKEGVTFLLTTPSLLSLMPDIEMPSLTTIGTGGDTPALSALRKWSKRHHVINLYGPTENTVTTTRCPVTEDYENNDIGTPIPGSTCYVLDEHLNLVPDYFPGELYIGGLKLMNGYLNRPDLNEQTLIANPYVSEADRKAGLNLRLYKTGDCVTRRSDGHLIFQGRLDNQVKLHGFRIELGEIENVLRLHPAVLQVAAVVSEENICAFVQTHGGEESGELKQELHALCEQKLPTYMIPARWYVVDSLPVNNSGKIDRKRLRSEAALRIPDTGPTTDTPATPPSSFSASLVLLLAQQMLHDNSITTETDLLQAGMNSIDIMTLVNQVNAMGIARIGVSQVYEQKCISRIVSQTHQPYYWASPYAEDKPVVVLITGDVLLRMEMFGSWLQDYSVLVFESFCEFFYRKEVDIHTLLAHYEEVVLPLMRTNPVILTGFCSNSEIAMRLAKRITDRHPELPKPHVVMMDAFQYREPEDISPEDAANTVDSHRNRILIPLCNQIGRLAYDGPVLLFQSHAPLYNVDPDQGEITDPDTRRDIERMFRTNLQNWRTHFPDAPLYLIEKDHWHFLCKETLQFVADKMKAHWKDMRG